MSKLQKKPSALKRGHPTLQNMNFYKFFSTFVGHFGLLDPTESGSNPDPDPQPCNKDILMQFVLTRLDLMETEEPRNVYDS